MKTKNQPKFSKTEIKDIKKIEAHMLERLREIGDKLIWQWEEVSQQVCYSQQLFFNEILRAYKIRAEKYDQDTYDRLTQLFTDLVLQAEKGILQAEKGKDTHVQ